MNKHYIIFIIFLVLMSSIFFTIQRSESLSAEKIQKTSMEHTAKAISDTLIAFRSSYRKVFKKYNIPLDETTVHFLPVNTMGKIIESFSKINTKITFRTVSHNPGNPNNTLNKQQLDSMEYFTKNKNAKSLFKQVDDKYYYTKPLYIKQGCLKCHSTQAKAPKVIRKNLAMVYNYKVGELRGVVEIELEQTNVSKELELNSFNRKIGSYIFFILIILIVFLYVKYNISLEKKINNLNKDLELKVEKAILETKKKEKLLQDQSRLAQMGEMISMIAHQWRQPLGAISSTVIAIQLKLSLGKFDLSKEEDRAKFLTFLEKNNNNITDYVKNLSETIDDFRNFFKPDKQKEIVYINEPINRALKIVENSMSSKGILINYEIEDNYKILIYQNELMQVILNILKNSEDNFIEKNIKNPRIDIIISKSDNDYLINISDNGGGIKEDVIPNIFNPYFSTKSEKNGTGLGLYMSKIMIEEHHNGQLTVKNTLEGVCFCIVIKENSE